MGAEPQFTNGSPVCPARNKPVRFGSFEVDLRAGELRKSGVKIKLHGQPFAVLVMLLERAGELVTREELQQKLWASDTFVDFEHGLNKAINKLREALSDDADNPRYIETLPRRGYRFIAPAREVAGTAGEPFVQSIAVLPLLNLSADPAQDYFADGMTEELITELAKISRLRVISRTSAMHFKGTRKTLPEVARELGVDAVVEGAVARDRNHVRISAQLIDARTDLHLWAQSYEGDLSDVLRLQERVALAIANEIKVKLTPQQQAHLGSARSVSPEAHELYLRGRFHWNKRTEEGLKKSIDYFQQAAETDPTYALAYSGLADSYNMLGLWGDLPQMESAPKAKAAAIRALEIDEQLAEAHASVAWTKFAFEWDWSGAERELQRSIELNPSYVTAYRWLANCLTQQGRHEEALTAIMRGHHLDPVSLITNSVLAYTSYMARHYDKAIEEEWKTLELDDQFAPAHWVLGMALEQKGQLRDAISEFQKATALDVHPIYLAALGHAYGATGQREPGLAILHNLAKVSKEKNVAWNEVAIVYMGMGEKEKALATLDTACKMHDSQLNWLKVEPRLDTLCGHPRFADLLRRMKLPQ